MEKETVLWLPGWGFSSNVFESLKAIFPAHTTYCSIDWGNAKQVTAIRGEAEKVLAQTTGTVTLVGWSLGAMVALELATLYPQRVKQLVLLAPTACFVTMDNYDAGWDSRVIRRMQKQLGKHPAHVLADFDKRMLPAESNTFVNLQDIAKTRQKVSVESLLAGLEYLAITDLRAQLGNVKQSVLLLHGALDTICPPAASIYVAEHLAGETKRVVLPNSGHFPFIHEHKDWIKPIRDFLEAKGERQP